MLRQVFIVLSTLKEYSSSFLFHNYDNCIIDYKNAGF